MIKGIRGHFPPATYKDIIDVINSHGDKPYLFDAIEKFLDTEPRKSLPEDIAMLLKDKGIKIGKDYISWND